MLTISKYTYIREYVGKIVFSVYCFCLSNCCTAASVEFAAGAALNLPSNINFDQKGYTDFSIDAELETQSFTAPVYYQLRVSATSHESHYWETELIHNKIFLRNPPVEIQSFSVSHGFNLFGINHVLMFNKWFGWRLGTGVILAHPENTVRGKTYTQNSGLLGWGYSLSGAYLASGVFVQRELSKWLFVSADTRVSSSYSRIPIHDGHASLFLNTLHATVATGVRW